MRKKKFIEGLNGKGYYIALVLCAVAIGITGFFYYKAMEDTPAGAEGELPANTAPLLSDGTDLPVVAPQEEQPQTTPQTTQPAALSGKPDKRVLPVEGNAVCRYSMDQLCYNPTTRDWRVHDGVDIVAEAGSPVCAAAAGTVRTVCEDDTMGMTVVICHSGGYTTTYASLSGDVQVAPGDTVESGQTIGYVGSTALLENALGDHVHFSVYCDQVLMDPMEFLEAE